MRKIGFALLFLAFAVNAWAFHLPGISNDKLSHGAGGVALGGLGVCAADRIWPEYRLPVGVVLGFLPGLVIEIVDQASGSGFSTWDLLADGLGSIIGAVVTDRFILKPVVSTAAGRPMVGLAVSANFGGPRPAIAEGLSAQAIKRRDSAAFLNVGKRGNQQPDGPRACCGPRGRLRGDVAPRRWHIRTGPPRPRSSPPPASARRRLRPDSEARS